VRNYEILKKGCSPQSIIHFSTTAGSVFVSKYQFPKISQQTVICINKKSAHISIYAVM